ncbi:cytochrome P450 [Streptomyces sp. RKAG293]|uniref:cytochrome P450 n=1 Tax=Streptomyces sp. RKAG293 TaxID=2893403 RepID=UPI0020347536|nr:cytochrome P450 [Streptomyces sp. RKAG293]MCM2417794.1 cytochrome P450 [Streptomyces sp. RKAG293]
MSQHHRIAPYTTGTAPGRWWLLGHAPRIMKDPLAFLTSLSAHADLVRISIGPWHGLVVCHPDLVHRVLMDDRTFDKDGPVYEQSKRTLGEGLVTCPHQAHRRQRRLLQPAFRRDRLPAYAATMTGHIDTMTRAWTDGQTIDAFSCMHANSARVATATLFAAGPDEAAIAEMVRCIDIIVKAGFWNMFAPLGRQRAPWNRRCARAQATLNATIDGIISDYRRRGRRHEDMLSLLLEARDEARDGSDGDGSDEDGTDGLAPAEVHDQVMSFLMAGIDTTGSTMAWACHLLAGNPGIQQRVRAEVHAVLRGRAAGWHDLPRLELTGRVISEALRLYPPGWLFTRNVTQDIRLGDTVLPRGTTVIFSPYQMHRQGGLFPDPERFDPDRWLTTPAGRLPRGAYIPFSAGARQCIGNDFGLTEATLTLATVIDRWHLHPLPGSPVRPVPGLALRPTPIPLRLHRTSRDPSTDADGPAGPAGT